MSRRPLKLTPGEQIFIQRRRNNDSQEKAAACALVSRMQFQRAEHDSPWAGPVSPPPITAEELSKCEELVLRRRRAKLTHAQVAERLECSRQWVVRMESGTAPTERLEAFWDEWETRERRRSARPARRGR